MKKIMVYINGIILSLFIIPITFADFQDGISECGFGNYGMMGYGNYGMGFGYILIFLLVIIGLTVFIYNNNKIGSDDTALDILKRRLVSGEISEKIFDSLEKKLNEKKK